MAIVKLTKKNFTSYVKEHIDNMGAEGLFASMLLGGKDEMKKALDCLPEEQPIYIDTKYVMAVTGLIRVEELNEIVFQLYLASPLKDEGNPITIKGEELEDFLRVWNGERKNLEPGTYKVGFGQDCPADWAKPSTKMWAEVSEDGLTVVVKEEKAV